MPITRDIEKYTKDYLSSGYDFERILVKYRRKKVLEILEQYKPKNILEIGCGTDSIANYYTDFKSFTIVEPSSEFAKQALKYENKNIKLYKDFFENKIDILKKENFDFIILSSLLHEVINPDNFLRQVIFVCGSNTILHINVPNSRSFHLLWAYEAGLIKELDKLTPNAEKMQRNTSFNMEKLLKFASDAGLDVTDKGSYFVKPFNHTKMQQLLNEGIIDEGLLDGLYNMVKYMPDFGSEIYVNCRLK